MSDTPPEGVVEASSARTYTWTLPACAVIFSVSAASDRGLVRRVNEDSYIAVPPVFVVADGMGGHAFGDRASQAIVRVLDSQLVTTTLPSADAVLAAIRQADELVQTIGVDEVAGSTLAGVALVSDSAGEPGWMAFNIGDSRIYRADGDRLVQLSVDHSAVQELVDEGAITRAEAVNHPERNVVTRAIGVGHDPVPDMWLFPFGARERFILCSDGLTKELDDATIEAVLESGDAGVAMADRLVAAALASGGSDNVTVVVVEAEIVTHAEQPIVPTLPAHLEETLPRG